MEELNKYQLIDGMINDLGNENNGVQVRGYRNVSIIKGVIEALVNLQNGLKQDEGQSARMPPKRCPVRAEAKARAADSI